MAQRRSPQMPSDMPSDPHQPTQPMPAHRCMIDRDPTVSKQFYLDDSRALLLCPTCLRLMLTQVADYLGEMGWTGPRPWEAGMAPPRRVTSGRIASAPLMQPTDGYITYLATFLSSMLARYLDQSPEAREGLPEGYRVLFNADLAAMRLLLQGGHTYEVTVRYLGQKK